jgi:choline-glycine betaine transporter
MLQLALLLLFPLALPCQEYPSCPGGSPLSVGNSTDPFNLHIIQLSTFLILSSSDLELAFEQYLSTGDDSQVTAIIAKNRNFYIIITVALVLVSLVLFVLLARMGDLKFSQKEKF